MYTVTTDLSRFDLDAVYDFLARRSYWSTGMPREVFDASVRGSVCFAVLDEAEKQVGFARVVTDRATFGYIADVYIDEAHRGRGLSKRLMEAVLTHPDLQTLRKWMLATADAQGLYAQFGFTPPAAPDAAMERVMFQSYEDA